METGPVRADRLVAALLLLQARGQVTAAELATELEISVRTARRDLEALSTAGVPVYSRPGKGGGWSLVGGARTDLSGLTAAEARTLFLVAGPSARAAPELKAALRKLVRALPASFRADAQAAASAVMIDAARWGARPDQPPVHLEALRKAVIESVRVRLTYGDRLGTVTERVIDPLGVVQKDRVWYLVGGMEDGVRPFRVDRVRSVVRIDQPAVRPAGFDLTREWESMVVAIEERRRQVIAEVAVGRVLLQHLRDQFGDDLSDPRPLPDGRIQVQIAGGTAELLAEKFAGWGGDVEVVGPEDVRSRLARIGSELVARYGPTRPVAGPGGGGLE
jgi:predicted DNA-binding transcriptional regulator YafY